MDLDSSEEEEDMFLLAMMGLEAEKHNRRFWVQDINKKRASFVVQPSRPLIQVIPTQTTVSMPPPPGIDMVSIGPPGVDPEPNSMASHMINIQVETVPPPTTMIVQAPTSALAPNQETRPASPPQKELRLPVALEQALAFKTERAKQLGSETGRARHISKLTEENEEWKGLLRGLQKENKELKGKGAKIVNQNNWSDLNESDKQFLQDRPDYLAIAKLAVSTMEAKVERQCRIASTCDLVYGLVEKHKKLQAQVTKKLINQTINGMDELDYPSSNDAVS